MSPVPQKGTLCAHRWSDECKAYRSLEGEKRQDEVARLIAEHNGQELADLEWGACNSNSPTYRKHRELCDLMRDVVQGKRQQQGHYYREHPDELRETYNACFDEFHTLRTARQSKEAQKLKKSFRCMTALDGARAAGIRGEFRDKL